MAIQDIFKPGASPLRRREKPDRLSALASVLGRSSPPAAGGGFPDLGADIRRNRYYSRMEEEYAREKEDRLRAEEMNQALSAATELQRPELSVEEVIGMPEQQLFNQLASGAVDAYGQPLDDYRTYLEGQKYSELADPGMFSPETLDWMKRKAPEQYARTQEPARRGAAKAGADEEIQMLLKKAKESAQFQDIQPHDTKMTLSGALLGGAAGGIGETAAKKGLPRNLVETPEDRRVFLPLAQIVEMGASREDVEDAVFGTTDTFWRLPAGVREEPVQALFLGAPGQEIKVGGQSLKLEIPSEEARAQVQALVEGWASAVASGASGEWGGEGDTRPLKNLGAALMSQLGVYTKAPFTERDAENAASILQTISASGGGIRVGAGEPIPVEMFVEDSGLFKQAKVHTGVTSQGLPALLDAIGSRASPETVKRQLDFLFKVKEQNVSQVEKAGVRSVLTAWLSRDSAWGPEEVQDAVNQWMPALAMFRKQNPQMTDKQFLEEWLPKEYSRALQQIPPKPAEVPKLPGAAGTVQRLRDSFVNLHANRQMSDRLDQMSQPAMPQMEAGGDAQLSDETLRYMEELAGQPKEPMF